VAAFPLLLQPSYWTASHNHHHRFANHETDFHRRRIAGSAEIGGSFHDFSNPLIVFTLIGSLQVTYYGELSAYLAGFVSLPVERRRVLAELAIGALSAVAATWLMGWPLLLYGWLPCAVAGSLLQSLYLISNHMTRPMVKEADALGTAVSVRLVRGWSHMDFGRHVEHHLFPHVPHNRLAPVTAGLREHFPARFQESTLLATTRQLFELPAYYLTSHVLTDLSGTRRVTIN
jgi:fatty acid desaturase